MPSWNRMRLSVCGLLALVAVGPLQTIDRPSLCHAQQGSFIEDLFRTVAEAQLERERRKRMEADALAPGAPANPTPPTVEDREIRVPSNVFPPGPGGVRPNLPGPAPSNLQPQARPGGGSRPTDPQTPTRPGSITVRSREAGEFVENLAVLNRSADSLVEELKRDSLDRSSLRQVLPLAYNVSAESRTLLARCNGLADPRTVTNAYATLDSDWRQLSFQLRSLDDRSERWSTWVRDGDRACQLMTRQLGIEPQFDRQGLAAVMLTAAAYIQSLMDDLEISPEPGINRDATIRELRMLREQLLGEVPRVNESSYEEIVGRFTEFIGRWQRATRSLESSRSPYVQTRLERIRECGREVYALVWMPPPSLPGRPPGPTIPGPGVPRPEPPIPGRPPSGGRPGDVYVDEDLLRLAASIELGAEEFLDDVDRYDRHLQPGFRETFLASAAALHETARQLHDDVNGQQRFAVLQQRGDALVRAFERITREVAQIEARGLTGSRAEVIKRGHRELVPLVARLAGALLVR